jgi:hypothetical protein
MNENPRAPIKLRLYLTEPVNPGMVNSILMSAGCEFGKYQFEKGHGHYIDTTASRDRLNAEALNKHVGRQISRVVFEGDSQEYGPFKLTVS